MSSDALWVEATIGTDPTQPDRIPSMQEQKEEEKEKAQQTKEQSRELRLGQRACGVCV